MERTNVDQATQDLAYIREVLARTATTMAGFGRIFIAWGIILLAYSYSMRLLAYWIFAHQGHGIHEPLWYLWTYLLTLLFPLAMLVVYWKMAWGVPAGGMGRQLMSVWGWTLILAVPLLQWLQVIFLTHGGTELVKKTGDFFTIFSFTWTIALLFQALLFTGAMTRFAFPKWLAILFLVYWIGGMVNTLPRIPSTTLIPFTLLLVGGYLEWERRRQDRHGTA